VVLLIIDTSGSMGFGEETGYGPDFPKPVIPMTCGLNHNLKCNRMQIVIEALTGSYTDEGGGIPWRESYCGPTQLEDGILDNYKDSVRFALASFDSKYSEWTYGNPSYRYGIKPRIGDGCSGDLCLVDFLNKDDPGNTLAHNVAVEAKVSQYEGQYGFGTPLGVALNDADWYLKNWQTEYDYNDEYWACRPKYVILFTDGNESTYSPGAGDVEDNAAAIYTNNVRNELPELHWPGKTEGVPVFLVGMGDREAYDADPAHYPINVGVLDAAANLGSGGAFPQAFMADNAVDLRAQFDAILSIIMSGSSSRTELSSQPSMAFNKSYQFKAYFDLTEAGPWQGHLVREEITDADGDGVPEYIGDPLLFEDKLAAQNPTERKIYSIYDDPRSLDTPLFRDMEEFKAGEEAGAGNELMCLPSNPKLPRDDDDDQDASVEEYADYIKDFVRGVSGKKNLNKTWATNGNPWLGDIFHASPVVVAPPSSLAPDYKYEAYFLKNRERPTMVYAGANDGMIHAFVGEDLTTPANDGTELWGFIPTKLLATIQGVRGLHKPFVDATPVIRDVYFNDLQEKDLGDNDLASLGAYRTVLIGGIRGGGNLYYALDVTNPDEPKYLWEYRPGISTAEDGGNPTYPYTDPSIQCRQEVAESWAQPIVGQIWVKRADNDQFQARSVAFITGGFMPGSSFAGVTSCIQLMEMTIFPTSLHVIDIETGKLLKRYSFTNAGVYDDMIEELEDYYELLESGNDTPWNKYANCKAFETDDFDEDDGTGWACGEKRANLQNPPYVPEELKDDSMCWECPADIPCSDIDPNITYAKACCANPSNVEAEAPVSCRHGGPGTPCSHDLGADCHLCDPGNRCFNCICTERLLGCHQPCGGGGDPACANCVGSICQDPVACCTTCNNDSDCPAERPVCDQLVCETALGVNACWGEQQMGMGTIEVASRCDTPDMHNLNAARNCSTRYIEYADGSIDFWLKTEGCFLLDDKQEQAGRLCFHVGGNFLVEGVAANPAAYNTTFGEFITRAFMPTTGGVIWRLDTSNGLYDDEADEGMMIEAYTDDAVDYGWTNTKFFDVTTMVDPETAPDLIPRRPIMAPPALGLTYNRSLVLFFGTGRTDDLEYYSDRDYFFAVEEVLDPATGKPTGFGELFNKDGAAAGTALKMDDGERLYGKPLVAAGKVIMTTFVADPDECTEGGGRMHIFNYDDTPADTGGMLQSYTLAGKGTPSPPVMVWTPTGPVVLAQQGAGVEVLPVADQIKPTAHALHWGQVL
ncbi:MAG: hypothetical protein JRF33_09415, partial [Deltaproteobacteria bacterium]|nr:hypothetical protein [Deltaproteobacteria bacterium]